MNNGTRVRVRTGVMPERAKRLEGQTGTFLVPERGMSVVRFDDPDIWPCDPVIGPQSLDVIDLTASFEQFLGDEEGVLIRKSDWDALKIAVNERIPPAFIPNFDLLPVSVR